MDLKIYNRIDELKASIRAAEDVISAAVKERESYYWKINLCNSSDSFNDFKEENPNHPLLQYCHVQHPENYGCLSDVIIRILKCDINKEDFIKFARLIVNPNVGERDFRAFNAKYSDDER